MQYLETQYNVIGYNAIGGGGLLFPLGPNSIPTQAIWPYMQQWHFDVQRDLARNTVLTVSYVGSKGTHLSDQRDFNQLLPVPASLNPYHPGQPISSNDCSTLTVNGAPVTGQVLNNLNVACGSDPNPYRPYTGFDNITGLEVQANSSYNAMQVSARHYLGHLQMSLAYTWSHSIDDSSDRFDANFVNSYDLRRTRASSNFDQRHLVTAQLQYTSGVGVAGGSLIDGIRGALFKGWTVTSQLTAGPTPSSGSSRRTRCGG